MIVFMYNGSKKPFSAEFDRLLYLPGGHTKFVIRRDPATKLYFTLSNNNTNPE
jgi:hypothetical protein